MKTDFSISEAFLDRAKLQEGLESPQAGALVVFEGWVRDHNEGRQVVSLEYECFEPLARKEAEKIMAEAKERFKILDARCVHRVGKLNIGDMAVWVGVISHHRDEAFDACRYVIDELKTRVPIWKKEFYRDGESGWVNCPGCAAHAH